MLYLVLATAGMIPQAELVPQKFEQTFPERKIFTRSEGQERAIILIHGFRVRLLRDEDDLPTLRSWQEPDSRLVKELGKNGDVYSFAYGQTMAVDRIAERSDLLRYVGHLRELGYRSIVIVGHSAGGLIARQLVEDYPRCGVTRVIQVCSPNAGSSWAKVGVTRPKQQDFLESLTEESRLNHLRNRTTVTLPAGVEFVCVVGTGAITGDGVVGLSSQWSSDLQEQAVPVYAVKATHREAIRGAAAAKLLSRLIHEPQPRWTSSMVEEARKQILGK
jgi:pimeloyl-ACP methyl ester carboxylesterase